MQEKCEEGKSLIQSNQSSKDSENIWVSAAQTCWQSALSLVRMCVRWPRSQISPEKGPWRDYNFKGLSGRVGENNARNRNRAENSSDWSVVFVKRNFTDFPTEHVFLLLVISPLWWFIIEHVKVLMRPAELHIWLRLCFSQERGRRSSCQSLSEPQLINAFVFTFTSSACK